MELNGTQKQPPTMGEAVTKTGQKKVVLNEP